MGGPLVQPLVDTAATVGRGVEHAATAGAQAAANAVQDAERVATQHPVEMTSEGGCCGCFSRKKKEPTDLGPNPNKPRDHKLIQQQLPACKPVYTRPVVTFIFLCVSLIFIPVGIVLTVYGLDAHEVKYQYDQVCLQGPAFTNNTDRQNFIWANAGNNASLSCKVTIPIDETMKGPIYLYYEIHGMYQNHRRYVRSHLDMQLANTGSWKSMVDRSTAAQSCVPLINYLNNESMQINPCGLVAWSYFNDTYAVTHNSRNSSVPPASLAVDGNVAYSSDIKRRFADYYPEYFNPELNWFRGGGNISGTLKQEQRLMVWMRLSHMSYFRKLWGKLDVDLQAGDTVTVDIINQYNTYAFSGKKYVVLSTTNWLGGSSIVLGVAYLAAGGLSLLLAVIYLLITFIKPRKFADTSRLMKKHAMMPQQLPAGGA